MGSECQRMQLDQKLEVSLAVVIDEANPSPTCTMEDSERIFEPKDTNSSRKPRSPPLIVVYEPTRPDMSKELWIDEYSEILTEVDQKYGKFDFSMPCCDDIPTNFQEKLFFLDESLYKGELDANWNRHGRGIEICNDGSIYIGYFSKNQRHGKGRLYKRNTFFYEGDFAKGIIEGYGHYYTDKYKYEGQFKMNLKHGWGVESFLNGSKYEGEFRKGYKEGSGTLKFKDGIYYGQFKNDVMFGKGITKWHNNQSYRSDWLDEEKHRREVLKGSDSLACRGEHTDDLKDRVRTLTASGKFMRRNRGNGKNHQPGILSCIN